MRTPSYKSLKYRKTLAGVDRRVAIGIWGLFVFEPVIATHQYHWVAIGIVLHLAAVWATKKDPDMFDIYVSYVNSMPRLLPGLASPKYGKNSRPAGFEQGL